eukprot:TRINITY_DN5267_c1_g1_i8.p1 TRINITY_DN5267_c1_g1~~TRINITY_DN5267_c1_g1_i8.p1  ORF type:complete len:672 (+),score=142.85 TRINITY_DN5267_c1_g1_i8:1523-3538(+)
MKRAVCRMKSIHDLVDQYCLVGRTFAGEIFLSCGARAERLLARAKPLLEVADHRIPPQLYYPHRIVYTGLVRTGEMIVGGSVGAFSGVQFITRSVWEARHAALEATYGVLVRSGEGTVWIVSSASETLVNSAHFVGDSASHSYHLIRKVDLKTTFRDLSISSQSAVKSINSTAIQTANPAFLLIQTRYFPPAYNACIKVGKATAKVGEDVAQVIRTLLHEIEQVKYEPDDNAFDRSLHRIRHQYLSPAFQKTKFLLSCGGLFSFHSALAIVKFDFVLLRSSWNLAGRGILIPSGELSFVAAEQLAEALRHTGFPFPYVRFSSRLALNIASSADNLVNSAVNGVSHTVSDLHGKLDLVDEDMAFTASFTKRFIHWISQAEDGLVTGLSRLEDSLSRIIREAGGRVVVSIGNAIIALVDSTRLVLSELTAALDRFELLSKLPIPSISFSERSISFILFLIELKSTPFVENSQRSVSGSGSVRVVQESEDETSTAENTQHISAENTQHVSSLSGPSDVYVFLQDLSLKVSREESRRYLTPNQLQQLKTAYQQHKLKNMLHFLESSHHWGQNSLESRQVFLENLGRLSGCSLENRLIPRVIFLHKFAKLDPKSVPFDKLLTSTDKQFSEDLAKCKKNSSEFDTFRKLCATKLGKSSEINDFNCSYTSIMRVLLNN